MRQFAKLTTVKYRWRLIVKINVLYFTKVDLVITAFVSFIGFALYYCNCIVYNLIKLRNLLPLVALMIGCTFKYLTYHRSIFLG